MNRFLKILLVIVSTFLIVSCVSTQRSALLTAKQAKIVALRLANDTASKIYHCQPFRDGEPVRFVAGHYWVWTDLRGYGKVDFQVTVELAADGSTNSVEIKLLDSQRVSGP